MGKKTTYALAISLFVGGVVLVVALLSNGVAFTSILQPLGTTKSSDNIIAVVKPNELKITPGYENMLYRYENGTWVSSANDSFGRESGEKEAVVPPDTGGCKLQGSQGTHYCTVTSCGGTCSVYVFRQKFPDGHWGNSYGCECVPKT